MTQILMEDVGGVIHTTNLSNLRKSHDGGVTLKALTESDVSEFMMGELFESESSSVLPNSFLHESKGSDGFLYIVGPMARCDTRNGNGRIYERGIWESVNSNKNIIERFNNGGSKGHLEHPKDGKTNLNLISHVMVPHGKTGIFTIDESGIVNGKARILNTTSGKQLQELYRGGVCVGFSSRGKGSTFKRGTTDYVAKDYVYDTHDAVASPSVVEAMPGLQEKSSSKSTHTLASSRCESIQSLSEASSMSKSKELLKQLEDNLRALAGSLDDSNDAISLASLRESLLDQQMEIRSVVEADPTSRDIAEELAAAAKDLRAGVTAKMEALKDIKLDESLKTTLTESNAATPEVAQLRETLRETKERMEYYRAACEELAEDTEVVTRKEYEAAIALSEGLLKKCKTVLAENESLSETVKAAEENGSLGESIGAHPDYQLLEERYEKALLIIEELTERIRGAQVADRVEEAIKIEPRFAKIRDDLLECQTVDEVNSRVERLGRLFVEDNSSSLSEHDVLAMLSEGFNEGAPAAYNAGNLDESQPAPEPRYSNVPVSKTKAHRMSLINNICGTTNFRK